MSISNQPLFEELVPGRPDLPVIHVNSHLLQFLIDYVPQPCFLVCYNARQKITVNNQLVNLLKYSSLEDFYRNGVNPDNLMQKKEVDRIKKDFQKINESGSIFSRKYNIIRKDGSSFYSSVYLKPLIEPTSGVIYGYLGTLYEAEKNTVYTVDKSFLHLFNDERFPDEVIIVSDFKGNIIASNKQFYLIDFFLDFSDKKINLFNSIDKSYHNMLKRRIGQLRKGIHTPLTEYKLAKDGEQSAYVEAQSKTAIYKNRKVIVSLIRDITIRKEAEKKLLYTVIQTEEKERQRFAQDLHDEIGPFLSGLKLYLHELNAKDTQNERRKELIAYLEQMINEAVDKIRTLSSNLMPQNLIEVGLSASIENLIDKLNQSGQINISLNTKGNEHTVEKSFVITLYRIVLELINNTIKHSGADRAMISLVFRKKSVSLNYRDTGKGFDLDKSIGLNKGIGLRSILNRVELYQGDCKFTQIQPHGAEFDIKFPLK